MNLNTLILIRMIWMIQSSQAINGRVDLDCVNVFGTPLQCATNVVARTSSDDQNIGKSWSARVAIQQVRQSVRRKVLISRDHLLVIDQIHRKGQVGLLKINPVIRRPELLCFTLALKVSMSRCESRQTDHEHQQRDSHQSPTEKPFGIAMVR